LERLKTEIEQEKQHAKKEKERADRLEGELRALKEALERHN